MNERKSKSPGRHSNSGGLGSPPDDRADHGLRPRNEKGKAAEGLTLKRFREWLTARPRPIHFLFLFMFLLLGIAATTTVRFHTADPLSGLDEEQLVGILADLQQREDELRAERSALQVELSDLNKSVDAREAAENAVRNAREQAKVLAGVVPVEGPGIRMQVREENGKLPYGTFVTTLAELRNAGAEAIQVNGVRLNSRSWFATSEAQQIFMDDVLLEQPYMWDVIGDSDTLAMALEIRGGAAAQMRAYGATVTITKVPVLQIQSVKEIPEPKWATVTVD